MIKKTYLTREMLLSRVKELEGIMKQMAVDSKGLEYENVRLKRLLYKSLHIGINADDIDQYGYFGIILEEAAKELSLSIHCLELSKERPYCSRNKNCSRPSPRNPRLQDGAYQGKAHARQEIGCRNTGSSAQERVGG